MRVSRRTFLQTSAAASVVSPSHAGPASVDAQPAAASAPPAAIRALTPSPGKAVPIADAERRARIEKARRLMAEHGMGATCSNRALV